LQFAINAAWMQRRVFFVRFEIIPVYCIIIIVLPSARYSFDGSRSNTTSGPNIYHELKRYHKLIYGKMLK
jgi:hypothetical protein